MALSKASFWELIRDPMVTGALTLKSPLLLLWATLLCAAVALSRGLLAGARSASPDLVRSVGTLGTVAILFLCGLFVPHAMMLRFVEIVGLALPFTYVGDMMRHGLIGTPLQYSVLVGSIMCLVWAIGATVFAWRRFSWDVPD